MLPLFSPRLNAITMNDPSNLNSFTRTSEASKSGVSGPSYPPLETSPNAGPRRSSRRPPRLKLREPPIMSPLPNANSTGLQPRADVTVDILATILHLQRRQDELSTAVSELSSSVGQLRSQVEFIYQVGFVPQVSYTSISVRPKSHFPGPNKPEPEPEHLQSGHAKSYDLEAKWGSTSSC